MRLKPWLYTAGVLGTAMLVLRGLERRGVRAQFGGGNRQWHVLTVDLPHDSVQMGGRLSQPLADLGDEIEVESRDAPGDRGTEIGVRLAPAHRPDSGATTVASALRRTKQILETGEVLRLNPKPEGTRPKTPGGLLIDIADRWAGEEEDTQ